MIFDFIKEARTAYAADWANLSKEVWADMVRATAMRAVVGRIDTLGYALVADIYAALQRDLDLIEAE